MEKEVLIRKFRDETERKVIHLEVNSELVIGSYVDGELMNVNVLNVLLDYGNAGYNIKVEDNW